MDIKDSNYIEKLDNFVSQNSILGTFLKDVSKPLKIRKNGAKVNQKFGSSHATCLGKTSWNTLNNGH